MIENKSVLSRFRVFVIYSIVIVLGLLCLFPLWNVLCISFSGSSAVVANRVFLTPVDFTTKAYEVILNDRQFLRSFMISVVVVIVSLCLNMYMNVTMGYALTRTKHELKGRNIYMGLMIFAMLFSGGTIPSFIVVSKLHLTNTIWSLILPGAVPIYNVILVKNFFLGIPKSLEEAAILDGANPLKVLWNVYIPCAKPVLATVALFSIVGNWNNFFSGLIYMTNLKNYPIMTYIQSLDVNIQALIESGVSSDDLAGLMQVSSRNLNAAKVVVVVVPLLLIYPLLQKYLITGIVMGSVKE